MHRGRTHYRAILAEPPTETGSLAFQLGREGFIGSVATETHVFTKGCEGNDLHTVGTAVVIGTQMARVQVQRLLSGIATVVSFEEITQGAA